MATEKKQVMLEELVKISADYVQGKITQEELDEYGKKITIRSYMPILEKLRLVMGIIFSMNAMDVEAEEIRIVSMERDLFFNVLLGGYAFIDVTNSDLKTYDSYDLLYPIFAPYILQYCERDYEKIVTMIRDSLNIYNMKELDSLFSSVDYQALKNAGEENAKLIETLQNNRETLAELRKMYELSHPAIKETYEKIEEIANDEIRGVKREALGEPIGE